MTVETEVYETWKPQRRSDRHCSAIVGLRKGDWGFVNILCRQTVGVRMGVTTGGTWFGYCAIPGHRGNVEGRYEAHVCTDCGEPVARRDATRCGDCSRKDRARTPLEERFWAKVDKAGPDDCWVWTGSTSKRYGYISRGENRTLVPAHRVSWELANGPIPLDLWVLHKCDNPPCVNPAHLFLGTVEDNNRDMFAKGRAAVQTGAYKPPRGGDNPQSRLTNEQRQEIVGRYENGEHNQSALGREYGVSHGTIHRVLKDELNVRGRFAEMQDPPEPDWDLEDGPDHADSMTYAKAWQDWLRADVARGGW